MDNLQNNKEKWEEQKGEFDKRMKSGENYIPESRGMIKDDSKPQSSLEVKNNMWSNQDNLEGTSNFLNTGLNNMNNE